MLIFRGINENDGGGEFNYDIFVRIFVNVTMYPSTKIILKNFKIN
jgi:hypothetical protein